MAEQMTDSGIEWIGNIPASWNVAPAKFFFINNKKIAGTQSNNYQRLALTLKGVVKRSKEDSDGLQPKDFDTYQIVHSNNLIFKLIDLENVRTSRVGLSPWEGIVSPAYIILAPRDNIEIRYTEYFYKFMWFCEIFNKQGNEGVRNSINVDSLLRIPIVSPPLAEQRAIADHLDSVCTQIDTAIGFKEKQLEELANYKKSLISECVCRGVLIDHSIYWSRKSSYKGIFTRGFSALRRVSINV